MHGAAKPQPNQREELATDFTDDTDKTRHSSVKSVQSVAQILIPKSSQEKKKLRDYCAKRPHPVSGHVPSSLVSLVFPWSGSLFLLLRAGRRW